MASTERRVLKRLYLYISPSLMLTDKHTCRYLERSHTGTEVAIIVPAPTKTEVTDRYLAKWVYNNQSKSKIKALRVGDVDEDVYIQRLVDFVNMVVLVLDKDDQFGERIKEYCMSKNVSFKTYRPVVTEVQDEEEKDTN